MLRKIYCRMQAGIELLMSFITGINCNIISKFLIFEIYRMILLSRTKWAEQSHKKQKKVLYIYEYN